MALICKTWTCLWSLKIVKNHIYCRYASSMGTKEVAAIGGLAKFSMYLNLFFGVFFGNILFYLATIKYIFFLWGLAFSIIFFDFSCAGFLFGSCPTHPQMQYFHHHVVFFFSF